MKQLSPLKLVATDMDGTLLDSQRRLPPGLMPLVRELRQRNVRFVIASGRQYYNLLKQFPESPELLTFLCENGAMIREGDQVLYLSELPHRQLAEPVAAIRALPTARIILCGVDTAYYENDEPEFLRNAGYYYERLTRVPDVLKAAEGKRICKIAVYDLADAEENSYPALKKFRPDLKVTLSGAHWVDLLKPETDKGSAIHFLQQLDGIGPENCIAFGDYLNDRELLANCFHSYAMANAHPLLKQLCRGEAPSNDDNGVIRVLRRQFGLSEEETLRS